MRTTRVLLAALAALAALAIAGPAAAADAPGSAYVLSNSTFGNAVLAYDRSADGSLTPVGSFPTGGTGTGAGLGSQGAVVLARGNQLLLAVNAGSDTISSFAVGPHGLSLVDVAPSGGSRPTSLTYADGLVYVLNAGTPNSIAGLWVDARGRLTPIPGSTRPLSGAQTNPAQVQFNEAGTVLVVSERATNLLTSYVVDHAGLAGAPSSYPSIGMTPFGFAFTKHDRLFVSDATGASGASSFAVSDAGVISTITGIAPTGHRAACWAVTTNNGKYGYVTNAATGNVSGFSIDHDGGLTLLDADGVTGITGGGPTDAAFDVSDSFLYIRNNSQNAINVFAVAADGSLAPLASTPGLPAGAAGIAAR